MKSKYLKNGFLCDFKGGNNLKRLNGFYYTSKNQ